MPTPRELTSRAADLVEELSRIADELYAVDTTFSDAMDSDALSELHGITPGLATRIRALNDIEPCDLPAKVVRSLAYQLSSEAA